MSANEHRRDGLVLVAACLAIALIIGTLRLLQAEPNPTIAALLLLLVVLATATTARLRVSIATSLVSMIAFNFFLLPPFHTFTIADPQNWIALFVFVVVAVIGSHLSAAARRRATEAEALLAERKKTEALSQRAALASALLASMSHDMRTPVTSIRVAVDNLQNSALPPVDRDGQAELAHRELDRLTRLLHDILEMARIDAAAVNPERDWVSPADVVDAAVTYAGPALGTRNLSIEADNSSEVQVDPRLTSSALAHVLENAGHYSRGDAPIVVRAWTDVSGAHFAVRDSGPGINPTDLKHIFEPFYRGEQPQHVNGTGLGLAIARGLLAAENGRISCENVTAGGAQFTLTVPCAVRGLPPPS